MADVMNNFHKPHTLNRTALELILEEPVEQMTILDVGCGSGILTLELSKHAGRVIGIDLNTLAINRAQDLAAEQHARNVRFYTANADTIDYNTFAPIHMVTAHYFLSDQTIIRAYNALPIGGCLVFVCLHTDNYKEVGKPSRYAYDKKELQQTLLNTGYDIDYLEAEQNTHTFKSAPEALDYFQHHKNQWEKDSRWNKLLRLTGNNKLTFTKSVIVGKARRT